jgi:hypothetical protein
MTNVDIDSGTVNGITSLTIANDIDVGGYEVKALKFESDQATGTAPLTVASTTVVTNLNADLLDGVQGALYSQIAATETLVAKTLTTPTITSTGWTNATHAHGANNSGGTLDASVLGAGTLPAARIAADSIVEGKLNVSNGPTNGQVLTARDGVAGGFTWEAAAGGPTEAVETDMENEGSSNPNRYVSPEVARYLPGTTKMWCRLGSDGTSSVRYNVASSAQTATGKYTITMTTGFSAAGTGGTVIGTANSVSGDRICTTNINSATVMSVYVADEGGSMVDTGTFVLAQGEL